MQEPVDGAGAPGMIYRVIYRVIYRTVAVSRGWGPMA